MWRGASREVARLTFGLDHQHGADARGRVVEREQLVEIVGDLVDCFAELGAVGQLERRHGAASVLAVLGVPDLGQGLLRAGVRGLGQGAEHVGDLVEPAALLAGLGEHLA
jgi:hypothetical protein